MKTVFASLAAMLLLASASVYATQQYHDCAEGSDEYVISPDAKIVLPQGKEAGT